MENYLFPFIALITSAIVTAAVMPYLLKTCYKYGLYDQPNGRKVHKHPIPRLGGIVFVPAMLTGVLIAIAIMHFNSIETPNTLHFSAFFLGSGALLIYAVGIIDDLIGCTAKLKFIVQTFIAVAFPVCGLYIDNLYGFCGIYQLPLWVSYPLTIFLTLLIINAINLIDGIDGLASTLSLIALVSYTVLFKQHNMLMFTLFAAGLSGALLAFLPFNLWGSTEKHRKTFMGDSGSLLLGIVLAYLTMKYAMDKSVSMPHRPDALLMAYTVVCLPCLDLSRVALCRLLRGQGITVPDKTHIHHKLMCAGFTPHSVLMILICIQSGFILFNIASFHYGLDTHWILLINILFYSALNIYLPTGELPKPSDKKEAEARK